MENHNWTRPQILNGAFSSIGLRPDKSLQLIAVDDIGAFAALAFTDPQEYIGKTLELAGDELTEPEIVATFTKVIGRPVTLQPPSMPEGVTPVRSKWRCSSSSMPEDMTPTFQRSTGAIPAC